MKKYVVIPEAEFTPAVRAHLKNYNSTGDALFREDTPDTVRRLTRITDGSIFVILKVLENTPIGRIRQLLPQHNGGPDKFKQVYNHNQFQNFLTEEFKEPTNPWQ